jgi:endonuclease/exonuclease/phosphatase (EEP) superfamily protein YafD
MLVVLLLYPQFFMPLGFIWVNGFLSLLAPYIVVLHLLFLFIWLIAKPILSLISVTTLAIAYPTILVLFAWHPGTPFSQQKKDNSLRIISFNVKEFNGNTPQPIGHKLRTEDIAASIQILFVCKNTIRKSSRMILRTMPLILIKSIRIPFFPKTIKLTRPIILQVISFIQNIKSYTPKGFLLPIKKA